MTGARAATALASPAAPHAERRWAVLMLVAVGTFMTTLDASIVNISLPTIARDFGAPLSGMIEWVVIAYLVTIAALQLTCGRLSDMVGRPPIWLAGLVTFTLGSGLCGAAPSLELLIAARAFQGIGGALIFATSVAILTDAFPAAERGRALSANAVAVALGTSAGPTLGGLLTEYASWRWIFYVNVPIALIAMAATLVVLRPTVRPGRERFDPLGALLLGAGVAAVTLGLSFGQEWGWTSPRLVLALGGGALALVAAVLVERVVQDPILDLALLRDRVFASALGSLVLMMLALFAVSFLLPFYFEELRGLSTAQSGLLLTPLPLTIAVVAPLAGALADRFGSRWLSPLGLATTTVGLLLLAGLDATSSIVDVTWRLVVVGIGQGLFQSPNTKALMGAAPQTEQGEASGLLATGRVIGQSLSVAIAGAVFAGLGAVDAGAALAAQTSNLSADQMNALQGIFVHGFRMALLVCATFAGAGILVALVRGQERVPSAPSLSDGEANDPANPRTTARL